jgi:hypothetical protein
MKQPNLTPRVQEALRQLLAGPQDMRAAGPQDMRAEALKPASVDDISYVRDRVRFSCPTVQSVVLMLDGLLEVKKLAREL